MSDKVAYEPVRDPQDLARELVAERGQKTSTGWQPCTSRMLSSTAVTDNWRWAEGRSARSTLASLRRGESFTSEISVRPSSTEIWLSLRLVYPMVE